MLQKYFIAMSAIVAMTAATPGLAQLFGPVPYTRSADTPAGFGSGPLNIENFEDAVIAPDLAIRGSIVTPSNVTDSVDYDDGLLDGFGRGGHTLQSSGVVRVEFLARPTFAGLVWTDGAGQVTFEAFGPQGESLGVSGPHALADGSSTGGTAEDRFFGLRSNLGISAIEVRANGGIEIDHVQWQIADSLTGNTASLAVPNVSFSKGAAVSDLHRLNDGKYLIAGGFQRIGNVQREAIARLNPDGSVDTSFQQTSFAPSVFNRMLVDTAGRIYVIDGARLLRLNPSGSRDTSFPQVNFNPTFADAMVLVSDGLLVGGRFTTITNGPARNGLVKVRFDGTVDPEFNLSGQGTRTFAALGADQVLIGGSFTNVGGISRAGIAKINTTGAGSVVLDWNAGLTGSSPSVQSVAIDASAAYIAGSFLAGASNNLAKVALANGAVDSGWNVSANGAFQSIRLINDSVYISTSGPNVLVSNPPAAATQRRVAKLNKLTGAIDAVFNPSFDGFDFIRLTQGDGGGRLMVAGGFTAVNQSARLGLAQLNADGSTDTVVVPAGATQTASVNRVAFDESTNRIYALGDFTTVNAVPIANFARISNGMLDTVWRPAVTTNNFSEFVVRPGSGIWVSHSGGVNQLNEIDGGIVPGWSNSSSVNAMTNSSQALYISNSSGLQRLSFAGNGSADPSCAGAGRSYVEMYFDVASNSIVGRPSASTSLQKVDAFSCALSAGFATPSLNSQISRFALDGKGGIWVSGNFTEISAQPRISPARLLLATGVLDSHLLPTVGSSFNFALGYDRGFLYGRRVSTGGDTVLLRLPEAGGAMDVSWKVAAQQGFANSIALGSDRIIAGGEFSGIAGAVRGGIAAVLMHDRLLSSGFE